MLARELVESADAFNRMDLAHELRKHRRLIAATRTHFEYTGWRAVFAHGGDHARHDPGLRDGLRMADGQGGVFIRAAGQRFIDEKMARHGGHGVQDALVGDALAAQTLHHRLAQAVGVQAQVADGSRRGRLGLTRQGRRGNAGIAIGGRDAGAEPAGRLCPSADFIQLAVLGQVQAQGRDRHRALLHRVEIRARGGISSQADRADPIDRVAIGRRSAHHRLRRVPLAQARDRKTVHVLETPVGDVDVEQHRRRQGLCQMPFDDQPGGARRGIDVLPAFFCQRERDGGNAEQIAFAGRGDRAGIKRGVAQVGGVVDAGHDNVGLELQQAGQRQVHAVGRRPG
ncbi:hypothetical protein G6F68_010571 [Rhizopus microsporus]|nr:hypothetical protein G6F68_010571 [Rhizopus microsporus]